MPPKCSPKPAEGHAASVADLFEAKHVEEPDVHERCHPALLLMPAVGDAGPRVDVVFDATVSAIDRKRHALTTLAGLAVSVVDTAYFLYMSFIATTVATKRLVRMTMTAMKMG